MQLQCCLYVLYKNRITLKTRRNNSHVFYFVYFILSIPEVYHSVRIDASVEKMAASAATASSSLGLCPNYAVICSFLERYGALLDLPELTFPQLERYLQDTSSGEAVKLHCC